MSIEASNIVTIMKQAIKTAYLAGFNASGEGYNGEYPFGDKNYSPVEDPAWLKDRENYVNQAIATAVAELHKESSATQERDEVTKLKGEIGVLVGLLGAAQQVIETIDAENAEESEALIHLHMKITYAIQGASSL